MLSLLCIFCIVICLCYYFVFLFITSLHKTFSSSLSTLLYISIVSKTKRWGIFIVIRVVSAALTCASYEEWVRLPPSHPFSPRHKTSLTAIFFVFVLLCLYKHTYIYTGVCVYASIYQYNLHTARHRTTILSGKPFFTARHSILATACLLFASQPLVALRWMLPLIVIN